MKVNNETFYSECSPEVNARILRAIENLVCRYRENLPDGWRCCVEFQRKDDTAPYYRLDLLSNNGGGDFAPVKMQMLRLFPEICATGKVSLPRILEVLTEIDEVSDDFFERVSKMLTVDQLTAQDWGILKEFGITHWYGGIRVPYDILLTDYTKDTDSGMPDFPPSQKVEQKLGEIRIAFSGAKEWQDTFFCFCIFERIQAILNQKWNNDQIWYNLRGFEEDPNLAFWIKSLDVKEAPL